MMNTSELPEWVNSQLERYESKLRTEDIIGFIGPLYAIESRIESLSASERAVVTEKIMQLGMDTLQSMKREGRQKDEFYDFATGSIASYLQNIQHFFGNRTSHNIHVSLNLAMLAAETGHILAKNMLEDARETNRGLPLSN